LIGPLSVLLNGLTLARYAETTLARARASDHV
jgi:hypothetical protein